MKRDKLVIRLCDLATYIMALVIAIYVYIHLQTSYPLVYYPLLPLSLMILIDKLPIMRRCFGRRRFYMIFTLMAILMPFTIILFFEGLDENIYLFALIFSTTVGAILKFYTEGHDESIFTDRRKKQFWVIYSISTLFFLIVFSPAILLVISILVKLYHHLTSI